MADLRAQISDPSMDVAARRDAELRGFVARVFGLRGTLRLHRAAFGLDLLRAPLNLCLAPVFLLSRLLAVLTRWLRMPRVSAWLKTRRVFFDTAVSARVAAEVRGLLYRMEGQGLVTAPPELREAAVKDYVATRSAVAEMVTTLFVLLAGLVLFRAATPGMISLAGPLAEMRAQAELIAGFPLGSGLGRAYYAVFPVSLPVWQVALTGVVLASLGALVTSFAGVLADPVQVATGTHRRRLTRLLTRLDRAEAEGVAREHVLARAGDLSDVALSLWRGLTG
ncbi:DUF6635 family protein [Pseudooceanicola sp.]|uniref:DUF6635 family protein n=2 Tax=Pseudooceanicola sp. TaxID=1914328 RepID=UPI0035C77DAC